MRIQTDASGGVPVGLAPRTGDGTEAGPATARRVLVVDDNDDSVDTTQLILELRGHVVMTACDARSALSVVETFAPEVVLLDIGLPDMDGYELADRLRQLPNARHALLVAVTGWGRAEGRARTHEHGFAAHMTKPFDVEAMLDLVATAPRRSDTGDPEGK